MALGCVAHRLAMAVAAGLGVRRMRLRRRWNWRAVLLTRVVGRAQVRVGAAGLLVHLAVAQPLAGAVRRDVQGATRVRLASQADGVRAPVGDLAAALALPVVGAAAARQLAHAPPLRGHPHDLRSRAVLALVALDVNAGLALRVATAAAARAAVGDPDRVVAVRDALAHLLAVVVQAVNAAEPTSPGLRLARPHLGPVHGRQLFDVAVGQAHSLPKQALVLAVSSLDGPQRLVLLGEGEAAVLHDALVVISIFDVGIVVRGELVRQARLDVLPEDLDELVAILARLLVRHPQGVADLVDRGADVHATVAQVQLLEPLA
mmetsp:Transcript_87148/g.194876  ORF Transcript_87148/g.194876 Transcript_87148/m.194876 type:complete len:318 (-) Transcript_87148:230-1183(-)